MQPQQYQQHPYGGYASQAGQASGSTGIPTAPGAGTQAIPPVNPPQQIPTMLPPSHIPPGAPRGYTPGPASLYQGSPLNGMAGYGRPPMNMPADGSAYLPPGGQTLQQQQMPPSHPGANMGYPPTNFGGVGPQSGYSASPPPPPLALSASRPPYGSPLPAAGMNPQAPLPAQSSAYHQSSQPIPYGNSLEGMTGYERPLSPPLPHGSDYQGYSQQSNPNAGHYAQQQQQASHPLSHHAPQSQSNYQQPGVPPLPGNLRPMMSAPQAPPQPKLSAAQMPNVISVQEVDQSRYEGPDGVFRSSVTCDILPPLPTTNVAIVDDGNCSSRFIRPTMYNIPLSEDLQQSAKIPLAMVIQPFAKGHVKEPAVPVVDFSDKGPIRCNRCRAYINLFIKFIRGGRQYECNICSMINDVPDEYFYNLDAAGRRADIQNRPELLYGSVDFVASKEYSMRKNAPPYLLLALDVSRTAIQNGAFISALNAVRSIVEAHLSGAHRLYAKIAIITFDKSINVYDLRASEPQILVMSDVHEPFVPLHDGLFFDPSIASEQVFALLDRLPGLFHETRIVDSCVGAAAAFALEAMKSHGGRVVLFSSTLPNTGAGLLKNRDSAATVPLDKVNPLVLPQGEFYTKLGRQASTFGISFVLVATPATYLDVASIGQLTTTTSGHIIHYPKFASDHSGEMLAQEVCQFLWRPFVYDTVLRVRAGSSLQTTDYLGNFSTLNQTDYQFAALNCDQSFAVTFIYDAKLSENEMVSFQCAVLHTTTGGERRIRVHNLALKVTSAMANIFRMADFDALVQFFCKKAVSQITSASLPNLITQFHVRSAQALASYRKFCAQNMPSGQLVLPESLKLLPIYCLAFSKSVAFSSSVQLNDSRMAAIYGMMDESMSLLPIKLYPRLFALHRLLECLETEPSRDEIKPQQLRLSQEFVEPHGIYLIDDAERIRILICSMVDPEILSSLFGVAQAVALNVTGMTCLPDLNNTLSYHARRLINQIQDKYDRTPSLQIIRQGIDASDADWQQCLIEDAQTSLGPSYVDFLCRLHGQINHEMSSSSLAEKTALLSFFQ